MKFIKVIIFIMFLTTATISADNTVISNNTKKILVRENVDLDSKSLKGWMRVFNSNEKLNDYEIYTSTTEREQILIYLKELYKIEFKKNSKVVR